MSTELREHVQELCEKLAKRAATLPTDTLETIEAMLVDASNLSSGEGPQTYYAAPYYGSDRPAAPDNTLNTAD